VLQEAAARQSASLPGPVSNVAASPSSGLMTLRASTMPALPVNARLSTPAVSFENEPESLSGERKPRMLLSLG
jgi:hypothetical protein